VPPQAPSFPGAGKLGAEKTYSGGPWVRVMLAVLRWPDGVTQVRDTESPGWNLASALCTDWGAPIVVPFTLVMTDPAVRPAVWAGLLQMVGETGWQLSHGERSRLYIARALLQDADLVVLDESFAALDPVNLQHALACVVKRARSLLVIAHR